VLTVVASLLIAQAVAASGICGSELPMNIQPGLVREDMIRLLDRSESFRHQCARIAAAPYVRVVISIAPSTPVGSRAQTVIERYDAGAIVAWVTLRFAEDYVELIPHELEHIIEQMDRVQLTREAAQQRAWRTSDGAYETSRAVEAGLRARQEFDALAVEAVQADGRKPPAPRHPIH
jgi:hypothetical protein